MISIIKINDSYRIWSHILPLKKISSAIGRTASISSSSVSSNLIYRRSPRSLSSLRYFVVFEMGCFCFSTSNSKNFRKFWKQDMPSTYRIYFHDFARCRRESHTALYLVRIEQNTNKINLRITSFTIKNFKHVTRH